MTDNKREVRYTPIIKWQQYEQKALSFLKEDVKKLVFPCLEVRDSKQHETLVLNFEETWNAPAMVDYSNPSGKLTDIRISELKDFLALSIKKKYPISAVLNPMDFNALASSSLIKSILKQSNVVFRLRLPNYFPDEEHVEACRHALTLFPEKKHHIIFDLCNAPEIPSNIDCTLLGTRIRTIIALGFEKAYFISGAFPSTLASVKGGTKDFPRNDLALWKAFKARNPQLKIIYGDYGILSPGWTEEILKRRGGSVAIRYTCNNSWFILRGTNATKSESRALSVLLINAYAEKFKGAEFSWGDKLIADRADASLPDSAVKAGHYHFAEAWNHHITYVVKED